MRLCKLKVLLAHPGIHELLALHRADALASRLGIDHVDFCEEKLRTWTAEELDPVPLITGDDLIAMGLKPGRRFKEILDAVRESQLDGVIRRREEALELARKLA